MIQWMTEKVVGTGTYHGRQAHHTVTCGAWEGN